MPRTIRPTADAGQPFSQTGSRWDYRGVATSTNAQPTTLTEIQISAYTSTNVNVWLNGFISFGDVTSAQLAFMANWTPQSVASFPGDFLFLSGAFGQATYGFGATDFDAPFEEYQAVELFYVDWSGVQVMFTHRYSDYDFTVFNGGRVIARIGSLTIDSAIAPLSEIVSLNVANLFGTSGDDNLVGGLLAHTLLGLDGADVLTGQSGDDYLNGGTGADRIFGGVGGDTIIGGLGADILSGGSGAIATGLSARDTFHYDNFADSSTADNSVDLITDFETGVDRIQVSYFIAPITGYSISRIAGEYVVTLSSLDGILTVRSINLVVPADLSVNSRLNLIGGTQNDTFVGLAGNDILSGDDGNDTLSGLSGDDILFGDAGDDLLIGGGGTDRLFGGAGNDILDLAMSLRDSIADGGAGNDIIYVGGHIAQSNNGGEGFDTLALQGNSSGTLGFSSLVNIEEILLQSGSITRWGQSGINSYSYDLATTNANVAAGQQLRVDGRSLLVTERLTFNGGAETDGSFLIYGGLGIDTLTGGSGNDTIDAGGAADVLRGGIGNDTLTGGAGVDLLSGGTGNDVFRDTAAGLNGDTITDFTSADRIIISGATLAGFAFNLSGAALTYSGGALTLTGGFSGQLVASRAVGGGVQLSVQALVTNHALNDFNGDGRSDILWRNTSGDITNWLGQANGSFVGNAANSYNNPGAGWTVAGTADFNGDGRDDVLWRHATGLVTYWFGQSNGGFVGNSANVFDNPGTSWRIVETGDFNGDGRDDILWRHSNGDVINWLGQANGGFVGNAGNSYNNPGAGWIVSGTGDFNGDGRDDILWRNANGDVTSWLGLANGNFAGSAAFNNPGTSWTVVGVGDFNGDGRDDVLWRNTSGDVTNWLGQANGGFAGNAANSYNNPGAGWSIIAVGDYNGDGRDDVLWRHANGTITNWLGQANGGFVGNLAAVHSIPSVWQVQPEYPMV